MKNLKVYKSLLLIGTTSLVLLTGCNSQTNITSTQPSTTIEEATSSEMTIQESTTVNTEAETTTPTTVETTTAPTTEETTMPTTEETITETETFDNFNSEKEEMAETIQEEDEQSIAEKGKQFFITAVDFIFYDEPYKGVTFDELTDQAKEQCYENLCTIDGWIMKISPDYKENISEKYNIVKDFLSDAGYAALDQIKEWIGEENYEAIGNLKDKLVDGVQSAGEKIGDSLHSAGEKIKEKADDWYQNFKEN